MNDDKVSCMIMDGDLYMSGYGRKPFYKVNLRTKVMTVKICYRMGVPTIYFIDQNGALMRFLAISFNKEDPDVRLVTRSYQIKDFCAANDRIFILTDQKTIVENVDNGRREHVFLPLRQELPPMEAILATNEFLLALDTDGNIWGNEQAQGAFMMEMRRGLRTDYTLYQITRDIVFEKICCANTWILRLVAISSNGEIYCTRGRGTNDNRGPFVKVDTGDLKFREASVEAGHRFFIDYDNNLWVSDQGFNFKMALQNVSQINSESSYTFVLLEDGTLLRGGLNDFGQLDAPGDEENEEDDEGDNYITHFTPFDGIPADRLAGKQPNTRRFKTTKSAAR